MLISDMQVWAEGYEGYLEGVEALEMFSEAK